MSRAISEKPAISPAASRISDVVASAGNRAAVAAHVDRLRVDRPPAHQLGADLGHPPRGARGGTTSSSMWRPIASSRAVAVDPLGGRVPARDRAVEPDGDDRVARGLDDRGQVTRGTLALAPLRDVADVADEHAPRRRRSAARSSPRPGTRLPSARSAVSSTGRPTIRDSPRATACASPRRCAARCSSGTTSGASSSRSPRRGDGRTCARRRR